MSSWSNTDAPGAKPKWNMEKQVREVIQLTTANTTNAGNNTITFNGNAAAFGVSAGMYVYGAGISSNGVPNMFVSNNSVLSVSSNNVIFNATAFASIPAGTVIEFDKALTFKSGYYENTYNSDTILVTASRSANANSATANVGNINQGWVHVRKKTNNDGTVRYIKETLVALASASASNIASSNTSTNNIATGL